MIGVDNDEYFTTFDGLNDTVSKFLISSSLKGIDAGVEFSIGNRMKNEFEGTNYLFDASNGGIRLAPCHVPIKCHAVMNRTMLVKELTTSNDQCVNYIELTKAAYKTKAISDLMTGLTVCIWLMFKSYA